MIPVAPNGEVVARQALLAGLSAYNVTVTVSTALPSTPPAEFVVISRINSPDPVFATDTVGLIVECYARTQLAAGNLANTARAALEWCQGRNYGTSHVHNWREASRPVQFSNPDTAKHVRYQFTGTLTVAL